MNTNTERFSDQFATEDDFNDAVESYYDSMDPANWSRPEDNDNLPTGCIDCGTDTNEVTVPGGYYCFTCYEGHFCCDEAAYGNGHQICLNI